MASYISAQYIGALLDYGSSRGLSPAELLPPAHAPRRLSGLVPLSAFGAVAERLETSSGDLDAGLHFGLTLGLAAHGTLGYAGRSSSSLMQALKLVQAYLGIRTNAIQMRLLEAGSSVAIAIDVTAVEPGIRRFISLMVLGSMARCYSEARGSALRARFHVPFTLAAESASASSPPLSLIDWHFQSVDCRAVVERHLLELPLSTSDPGLHDLLASLCRDAHREMKTLPQVDSLVREILRHQMIEPPTLVTIARQMGLSDRTLKRRLARQGTSYSRILADLRRETAIRYLLETTWTVEEIAYRLGYASTPSFTLLFRQWTGRTPGEMRRGARARPSVPGDGGAGT
jgi:AraC-like DNA-binding protein